MINSPEKEKYFSQKRSDVAGSPTDEKTYIYLLEKDRMMVRETHIDSGKGGEPVQILQFTDTHLNRMSERDYEEKNPVVMSTRQFRMAFRNESTVQNFKNAMKLVPFFDKTVITGDILDYLTWGTVDLVKELITDKSIIMTVGGHDYTRKMEGLIPDNDSDESRLDILKTFWNNDLFYHSEILGDKALIVALFDNGKYFDFQIEKFKKDLEKARKEGLVILIFQHEQLCTYNPAETAVLPFRPNTKHPADDFSTDFTCNGESDETSLEMYRLITENADIVKGIFCGHHHGDYYTEIIASYKDENGNKVNTVIPQYVLTGNMYDEGHVRIITVY